MKHFSLILLFVFFVFTSCTEIPALEPVSIPPDTAVTSPPEDHISPLDPKPSPVPRQSKDSNLARENVYIESAELLIRESFPPQISLGISGNLPTPCHILQVDIHESDLNNTISVDVYSVTDAGTVCIQVLKPFQEYIDLGTFPTGHYIVWVNGDQVGEFDT
jgi:hypothetical protein